MHISQIMLFVEVRGSPLRRYWSLGAMGTGARPDSTVSGLWPDPCITLTDVKPRLIEDAIRRATAAPLGTCTFGKVNVR